uniref:Retrotransposon gag domain-containing protein n=1 Tax=Chromera velia CCMP2878 TaxID=1169474 RepID=A0A0G4GT84_9ALVE|eukprot:Cvel_23313.t1-p1 / transcript=Cvel_23313.t1 / gene=Cvel_23313 / organism=Chromera_velia_CCMP2878 / gene_product=hypothetical protein / transcript_product=hypothetical protein / location=Cvel_scaffold2387:26688-27456(+) / protein_length=176 / sequence_SO=supercontig / SO=protein_coding / is_pseudo=false
MSQDLKEWFDLYEVENGPFQNWESLKAALIEHYSDTLARQKARKDLKKCQCIGAGVNDYNKRFKPLVAKLKGRLIKEDIVEDYISGLPADVRLETNKAHPREGVSDAASQGILLGSVQIPSLDSAETSLECEDSMAEGTLGTRRTTGDSVETSSKGDGGRAEADTREIAEGLELHS